MRYNSFYVTVRGLADGNSFSVGPVRTDENGEHFRVFTIYGEHPWQGELVFEKYSHERGWYYHGECWPL